LYSKELGLLAFLNSAYTDSYCSIGASGIGYYICAAFMQAGAAKVIIASRKEDQLKAACNSLNSIPGVPGRASYIVSNVSTPEGVDKLTADLKKVLPDGKLHILVNNAAASWGGPFEDYEDWKVAKTFDVNVRAVFNLTRT
jgi:NAD(P)-dependent dehydrogenase (short-subunit alcohol dehydrogenase family)